MKDAIKSIKLAFSINLLIFVPMGLILFIDSWIDGKPFSWQFSVFGLAYSTFFLLFFALIGKGKMSKWIERVLYVVLIVLYFVLSSPEWIFDHIIYLFAGLFMSRKTEDLLVLFRDSLNKRKASKK